MVSEALGIAEEISLMVDRLERANIPRSRLAFEVEQREWDELVGFMARMQRFSSEHDLQEFPPDDLYWMGLHVRKRNRR